MRRPLQCLFIALIALALNACSTPCKPIIKYEVVRISVPKPLLDPIKVDLKKVRTNKEVIEGFLKTKNALKQCNNRLKAIRGLDNGR